MTSGLLTVAACGLAAACVLTLLAAACLACGALARLADRRRGRVRLRRWRALVPARFLRGEIRQDGHLSDWERARWHQIVQRRRTSAPEPPRHAGRQS